MKNDIHQKKTVYKVDFSKKQKRDYIVAAICAPFILLIVWVLVCGFLLAFGTN